MTYFYDVFSWWRHISSQCRLVRKVILFHILQQAAKQARKKASKPKTMYYTKECKKSCDVVRQLLKTNMKMKRACEAVVLINKSIQSQQIKFNRFSGCERPSCRISCRNEFELKQYTMSTSRKMFFSYISQKADEIEQLKETLVETENEFYAS